MEDLKNFTVYLSSEETEYIKKKVKNSWYAKYAKNDQQAVDHYLYSLLIADMEKEEK